jgi:gamma-glutamyl hercynylcysteine S-oxide synthase
VEATRTATEELAEGLGTARELTLALVAPYSDDQVETAHNAIMSPLAWDLAHIAAYEDLWLVHRYAGEPLLHPELADTYDAFETPRAERGSMRLLNRAEALEYLAEVRERVLAVLDHHGAGDGRVHEMVLRHEYQHTETMLQAIALARLVPEGGLPVPERPAPHGRDTGLERVTVPGGACSLGAPAGTFSYDNERPCHRAEVPAFSIGRTPITNATFLHFVEGGGYERREWWTDEGWQWKEDYDITHPGGWSVGGTGWRCWRLDGWAPLHPDEPVVHLSWFEADAFARAHGARLPTETEWEKAATWDQETGTARRYPWGYEAPAGEAGDGARRANLDQDAFGPVPAAALSDGASPCGALGMLGDTWEWTSTTFHGYPGFVPHPYKEYSEVFFGPRYRVLRGGSWATRSRVATPTFRNWDLPERRQIFSGLRLAWDA